METTAFTKEWLTTLIKDLKEMKKTHSASYYDDAKYNEEHPATTGVNDVHNYGIDHSHFGKCTEEQLVSLRDDLETTLNGWTHREMHVEYTPDTGSLFVQIYGGEPN
jgi:hypothetical protein